MGDVEEKTIEGLHELADALVPLLELSNGILVVQKELEAELSKKERSNLTDAVSKFEEELSSKCLEFSNAFIYSWQQNSDVSIQQFF